MPEIPTKNMAQLAALKIVLRMAVDCPPGAKSYVPVEDKAITLVKELIQEVEKAEKDPEIYALSFLWELGGFYTLLVDAASVRTALAKLDPDNEAGAPFSDAEIMEVVGQIWNEPEYETAAEELSQEVADYAAIKLLKKT